MHISLLKMDKSLLKKKIDNEKKQVKIIVKDNDTGIDRDTTKAI